jgi:hypothetical protein
MSSASPATSTTFKNNEPTHISKSSDLTNLFYKAVIVSGFKESVDNSKANTNKVNSKTKSEVTVKETRNERIKRLSPANLNAAYGTCSIKGAIACYRPILMEVVVTKYGLTFSDARLRCALKHEARHKWQDENGLIKYSDKGEITNRKWLEADARKNGCG